MIAELITRLGPWAWIILGVVLVGLELTAPGVFLVWLGLAAIATGLIDAALSLSWQVATLIFAALSVVAVLVGRSLSRPMVQKEGADAPLNRRGEALVGRVFTLDQPMSAGEGRVRVGDSFWRVTGPDAPVGANVRVVRVEGTTLVVEAS